MDSKDIQKILEEQRQQAAIYQKTEHTISTTINNRTRATDPEWLEAIRKGAKKRNEENKEWYKNIAESNRKKVNTDWKEKNAKILKERAKDPEWQAKHADAMKKKFDDPEYVKKHAEAMKSRTEDPKFMAKMKTIAFKPIITPYGVFASITLAGLHEEKITGKKFNPNRFTKLLKEINSGYKRITREEYIMLTGKDI